MDKWYLASTTKYGELGIEKKYKISFAEATQSIKYRYEYDRSRANPNCNQHDRNTTLDGAIFTSYIKLTLQHQSLNLHYGQYKRCRIIILHTDDKHATTYRSALSGQDNRQNQLCGDPMDLRLHTVTT